MVSKSRSRASSTKKGATSFNIINSALLMLYTVLSLIVTFMMYTYNFLAFHHLNLVVAGILFFFFILWLILIVKKQAKILSMISLILANLILALTLFAFKSTIDFTAKINKTASFSEVEMSVVVPKDSQVTSISEVKEVQAPTDMDHSNISALLKHIKEVKKTNLSTNKVASYKDGYDSLMADSSKAMVLNSAYGPLIEQADSNYKDKLKTIYTYKVKKAIKSTTPTSSNKDVINVYISGIDTYGPISTVSRSDVNIILTANTKTHQVLLTTTPRDSYVKIPGGGADQYDKLTHAGIYGVETSMATLENLYGIKISNYARINFTTFMDLIDLLGGIEVVNDTAFTSYHGNYVFPKGNVKLNSERALGFVRERYSLQGGDNDRGKNQEKVISAVIQKLASIKSPSQFTAIVSGLQNSVQTNLSLNQLLTIANSQVADRSSYTVTSQAVTGTGSTGELPSYAMPGSALYMLKLDEKSVEAAKEAIKNTMEGN
ncbi:LCP family glycopolymer transferase CpsA [Streptococcus hongkongensis]|nr:LytR family transcriptional regulator [Streptococcus uberis]